MARFGFNTGLDGHRIQPITEREAEEIAEGLKYVYAQAREVMLASVAKRLVQGNLRYGWAERKANEVLDAHQQLASNLARIQRTRERLLDNTINRAYISGSQQFHADMTRALGELGIQHISPNAAKAAYILADLNNSLNAAERRILRQFDDRYADTIALVSSKMATGIYNVRQAIGEALIAFADKGIDGFIDRGGHHWTLENYAEMATLTAIERSTIAGYVDTMQSYGYDLAVIDGHAGSCPICAAWEGVIVSVSGDDPRYPSLDEAENDGCFHPRCMHGIYTYYEGISHPPAGGFRNEPREKHAPSQAYTDRSRQRYAERMIRKYKDRAIVAQTPQQKQQAADKVREWEDALDELIRNQPRNNYLYRHREREGVLNLVTGAKKKPGWEDRHAQSYYEEVRKRAPYTDAAKIEKYTGLSAEDAEAIRRHVFLDEHLIDGVMRRFDADYYQAQAWQRLTDGKGTDEDLIFLKHELRELTLEREMGYNHEEAHEMANSEFNWWSMVQERLGMK